MQKRNCRLHIIPICHHSLKEYLNKWSPSRDKLIQHNKLYWISNRSGVAEPIWTVTQ